MSAAPATPSGGDLALGRRLIGLVDTFRDRSVLVLGDIIADEFIYGQITRVSREAPVLILKYDSTEIVPGGAGNAANNVAALGGTAQLVGLVGRDEPGRRALAAFNRRVDTRGVLRPAGYRTTIKTRILAGGVHSAKQQVVRIDRENRNGAVEASRDALERRLIAAAGRCDAVLVSDYGLGVVTPELVLRLRDRLGKARRGRAMPILVDSRYELLRYRALSGCTPNESEIEHLLGVSIGDNAAALERAGRLLLRRTAMDAVLVTRGGRGMALFEPGSRTAHIGIYGSDQIADVTGAGDTVIATLTLALAAGATWYEAARLANYAGGIVVMKRGTATVSRDELRVAVKRDCSSG